MYWIIGIVSFLAGFFFCMFLALTVMYYKSIEVRRKEGENVSTNQ